jgi:hypothetical protein
MTEQGQIQTFFKGGGRGLGEALVGVERLKPSEFVSNTLSTF